MLVTEKGTRRYIKMKQEIAPKQTSRALAFELWMKSPMPMVTLVKTFPKSVLVEIEVVAAV